MFLMPPVYCSCLSLSSFFARRLDKDRRSRLSLKRFLVLLEGFFVSFFLLIHHHFTLSEYAAAMRSL